LAARRIRCKGGGKFIRLLVVARMGHSTPTMAIRYQHVMEGRDAFIASALHRLIQTSDGGEASGTLRKAGWRDLLLLIRPRDAQVLRVRQVPAQVHSPCG
jgi:hypothetical protein